MPQLQELPTEILVNIFEDDNESGAFFLSRVACTNSFFRDLALPILRRNFKYHGSKDDYYGDKLAKFVESFVKCSELQQELRSLRLYNWHRTIDTIETVLEDVVPPQVGWKSANKIPAFLVWNSVKLKKLEIEYPHMPEYMPQFKFLDGVHPSLESLTVLPRCLGIQVWRPKGYMERPLHGTVDIQFLPRMLQSPKLTALTIKTTHITNDNEEALSGILRRTSSVKHLSFHIGNMTDEALRLIVNAPESLISFEFRPTTASDMYFPDSAVRPHFGSRVESLPSTSTIGAALRRHFDTLEHIALRRGDSWWHPNLDKIGTLRDMQSLRELELDAFMLLGFNHCEHTVKVDGETCYPASSLASLLPASLVKLKLYLDGQHHVRNGGDYVYQIIEGIVNDLERLASLTRIGIFPSNHAYCEECDHHSRQMKTTVYNDIKERHISLQEARKVKNLLVGTGIHFERGLGSYWDEEEIKIYFDSDIDEDFNVLPESGWGSDGTVVEGQTQVNIAEMPAFHW